jgi:hypothetical protein
VHRSGRSALLPQADFIRSKADLPVTPLYFVLGLPAAVTPCGSFSGFGHPASGNRYNILKETEFTETPPAGGPPSLALSLYLLAASAGLSSRHYGRLER